VERIRIAQHPIERQRADTDGKAPHEKNRKPEANDEFHPQRRLGNGDIHGEADEDIGVIESKCFINTGRLSGDLAPASIGWRTKT
jgi:hypothetical protein